MAKRGAGYRLDGTAAELRALVLPRCEMAVAPRLLRAALADAEGRTRDRRYRFG